MQVVAADLANRKRNQPARFGSSENVLPSRFCLVSSSLIMVPQ